MKLLGWEVVREADVQQLSNHFTWLSGILGCDWSITSFPGNNW